METRFYYITQDITLDDGTFIKGGIGWNNTYILPDNCREATAKEIEDFLKNGNSSV
jgi:hypothetical protein